jgi:hypothetical protein
MPLFPALRFFTLCLLLYQRPFCSRNVFLVFFEIYDICISFVFSPSLYSSFSLFSCSLVLCRWYLSNTKPPNSIGTTTVESCAARISPCTKSGSGRELESAFETELGTLVHKFDAFEEGVLASQRRRYEHRWQQHKCQR